MKKSDVSPLPQYYDRYINLVPDRELAEVFDDSLRQLSSLDRDVLERVGDKTYAPGKWTVKDIIQHLIDGERIMCYRALLFARRDGTIPPGFDQELLATNANAERRTTNALIDELLNVRRSTIDLFDSFDDQMLQAKGTSWEHQISVLHLGFTIVGHQIHHLNVIAERYSTLERAAPTG
jgi:hypothetical protein